MSDKIKASCENCGKCDKSDFRCSQTGSLVNKCEYCSYYDGNGQTSRIDVRKLVKPLVWKPLDDTGEFFECEIGDFIWEVESDYEFTSFIHHWNLRTGDCSYEFDTLEEAKIFVQDWLVSLVANACGLESEVRK